MLCGYYLNSPFVCSARQPVDADDDDDYEDPHEDDVHHVDLVGGEAGAGHVVAGAAEHLLTLTRVCVECLTNVARVDVSTRALARGIVPDMSGGVGASQFLLGEAGLALTRA